MQNEELKYLEQRIASEAFNLHADIDLLWNVASRIKQQHQQLDDMYKEYRIRLEQKERELQEREMKIIQKEQQLQQIPSKPMTPQLVTTGFIAVPAVPPRAQPNVNSSSPTTSSSDIKPTTKDNNEQVQRNGATVVLKPLTISSSTSNPPAESSPRKVQFSDEAIQKPIAVDPTPLPQQKPTTPTTIPSSPNRLERSQSEHERTLSEKESDTRLRSYSDPEDVPVTVVPPANLSHSSSSVETLNKENQTNASDKPLERYSMFIPFDNPKKKAPPRLSSGSPASKSFVQDRIASFSSPPKTPVTHSSSSPAFSSSPSRARPRSTMISKVDFAAFEAEAAQQAEYSSPRKTVTSK